MFLVTNFSTFFSSSFALEMKWGKLKKVCKSEICSFILLNSNVISDVLFSISFKMFFTSHNCKVTSSTVLFILLINVSCNWSRWSFKDFRILWISSPIPFFRVIISCIFSSLLSVSRLTKEPCYLGVCSRSNIDDYDLTCEKQSVIEATPEHSLCAVRTHVIQHGRLCTGQYIWYGSSWSSQWCFMARTTVGNYL